MSAASDTAGLKEGGGLLWQDVILSCEHLKKSYQTPEGEKVVIEDISLSVKENEFVVLFGAGQCGKDDDDQPAFRP